MSGPGVRRLIGHLSLVDSVGELEACCASACRDFGFDHVLYASRRPRCCKAGRLVISTQPSAWRERYAEKRYIAVDPTVRHCARHVRPLLWEEVLAAPEIDRQARRFMADARAHGLVSGVTIPLHGAQGESGLLSLTSSAPASRLRPLVNERLAELYLYAAYVQEAVGRLRAAGELADIPSELTPRERECLAWTAEGKTSWETSQILGISERTVIFHLRNAAAKLNVATRQQAVARAIGQGLIAPPA